jgi:SM-20-related protein
MLHLEALRQSPVVNAPFSFFMVRDVLDGSTLRTIGRDFPAIAKPGIFPLEELQYGPAFKSLVEEIRGADLEHVMEEKFGVDLSDKPLMITVRGHCQRKDGRIHTDSTDKIVTCLLYLNEAWQQDGGRLRLLRSGDNIEDAIVEIPPDGGTLVAFKRSDNSWHGHLPYEGPRRYVMFNWVRSEAALTRNVARHRISAKLKRFNPFG